MVMLYTKREHGFLPVEVSGEGWGRTYRVCSPGGVREYDGLKSFLVSLYGFDPKIGHDRYFGVGKWRRALRGSGRIRDLFNRRPEGIDLATRALEVEKLARKAVGSTCQRYGYSFEDFLQEVYKGILIRNAGKCPWDPRKASFGNYVTMIVGCVFSNYHKAQKRKRGRERTGYLCVEGRQMVEKDVAEVACDESGVDSERSDFEYREVLEDVLLWMGEREDAESAVGALSMEVLPLYAIGMKRGEIASEMGISKAVVGKCLAHIREVILEWGG